MGVRGRAREGLVWVRRSPSGAWERELGEKPAGAGEKRWQDELAECVVAREELSGCGAKGGAGRGLECLGGGGGTGGAAKGLGSGLWRA